MAIRGDSYSSIAEVTAFVRHQLRGEPAFNTATQPTETEVEKFIDRASAALNLSYWKHGYDPANIRANSTAKLYADDWVTFEAGRAVEATHRGAGYWDSGNDRQGNLRAWHHNPDTFVKEQIPALINLGVTRTDAASKGLSFTGLKKYGERSDPDDSTLEQPAFRRRQWETSSSDWDE